MVQSALAVRTLCTRSDDADNRSGTHNTYDQESEKRPFELLGVSVQRTDTEPHNRIRENKLKDAW